MSKKVLLLTVGGSCQPIVASIQRNHPDFVVFFCSDDTEKAKGSYVTVDGEGLVCGPPEKPDTPSIVKQTNFSNSQYEIVRIKEFDNHNFCYQTVYEKIIELQQKGYTDIVGDYTGGTKSMTGGLLLAFSHFPDLTISVVRGERNDLVKVSDGTQRVVKTRVNLPLFNATINSIQQLGANYEYKAALNLVNELDATPDLTAEQHRQIDALRKRYTILNEWDSFNHETAYELLKENQIFEAEIKNQLLCVLNSRRCLVDQKKIPASKVFHRYELIYDLILNVKRKQAQHKFEDAMGRLYRSLELLAQARLMLEYQISTSDIKLESVPEDYRPVLMKKADGAGKIRIGLVDAYDLLCALKDPVIAELFTGNRSLILKKLESRNFSILAHGFNSLSESEFKLCYEVLAEKFILQVLQQIAGEDYQFPKQLPT